jgi:cation diffusion facilitator CzcD-associated flavoprotein CzcO
VTDHPLPNVCIIGAGCSGFTLAKRLKDHGIAFDLFEASDNIGGNWYFNNPNGLSACYKSLHIDTSKWRLAFEDYPVPADWPDYPHHSQLLQYFHDYVDHFGLRPLITFNTRVEKAVQGESGGWVVTLASGETRHYDALAVCNGHHWAERVPDYPGTFDGDVFHSHKYRDPFSPVNCVGKRVLVVGMGNSAMDVASELSSRPIAEKLFVSARRGVWVLPKYYKGKPLDKLPMPHWVPGWITKKIATRIVHNLVGKMEDYGLPKPDIGPFNSHATVSGEFLLRAGSGDLTMKPGIEALQGDKVRFTDGSVEQIDVIIYATGYQMRFPFFDDPVLAPDGAHRFPLFKRMIKPGYPTLFFMGLAQAVPTLVNFSEQQSKLIAAYLTGRYALPSKAEMEAAIAADDGRYLSDYYEAPRHTLQVDFNHYVPALMKEIKRGEKRAAASGFALPVPGRERVAA